MIRAGEALFGLYEWGRFDILVPPPSFPYGSMGNPTMVFLTPTVIKGDGTRAQAVALELAYSWTGNLITNKTNEHLWLNKGFATYAERRIVEVVQGAERAALKRRIGWKGLNDEMERFKNNMEFTKLNPKLEGVDPQVTYSQVPYEKVCQFLWRIERQIGRPSFDQFLEKYIAAFKFKAIDTETFLQFLTQVVALEAHYRLSEFRDYDALVAFLRLAIYSGCTDYSSDVEIILREVGRMKYVRPLYTALASTTEGMKRMASRIFGLARNSYILLFKVLCRPFWAIAADQELIMNCKRSSLVRKFSQNTIL